MKDLVLKLTAGAFYLATVVVNFLATSLPINNRSTGEISEAYPNLFTPAGVTFSIWGLIYLLLAGYIIYQFLNQDPQKERLMTRINSLFILSSIANIAWILAWHYDYIGLSLIIMAVLLLTLIKIADILRPEPLNLKEKLFLRSPFSIYFGWISVAAIANVTVLLVSIGWDGFGAADHLWTVVILLAGALIGILRTLKDRDVAYGAVFVWAYLGILLKHLSTEGWAGQYPSIIITASICLLLFVFLEGWLVYAERATDHHKGKEY